jgi:SAM-dependent methyltransferase
MNTHLNAVAKSYDRSISSGRKGIDLYKDLPKHLKNDPDYPVFEQAREAGSHSDSGRKEIREYLSPDGNMHFVDLGCCLNLMFNGYAEWPSTYYGVDISTETIQLLKEFSAKNRLNAGALHCGSIHETPFGDMFFDIGACIGVLEYFEKDFVTKALKEAHRILKPSGRFVLDIPDISGKMRRFMNLVEASMGRPDKFDLSPQEFEAILSGLFEVEKTEKIDSAAMIQYFLRRIA